jgi:hypothetical protein
VLPDSGWISCWLTGPDDVAAVIELFRMQYDRYVAMSRGAPASDPPGGDPRQA